MKNSLWDIMDSTSVPNNIQNHYNYRIDSLLEYLSDSRGVELSKNVIEDNNKLWNSIIKSTLVWNDLVFNLMASWYTLINKISVDDILDELQKNKTLLDNILEWKVLLWFSDDFNSVIIVRKVYTASEVVSELIIN